ncbi:MAG: tRNA (adenosine(37)-N6)-threonylcarbamoyltransferase complex transferase subunit TsaD [Armatimonadetes bacterium]|nr:tRNA (adenosine(37)-N6)-threonylcarbamoyltransferase complex transferase subunit TsaD [Armatimonadota bacterium]
MSDDALVLGIETSCDETAAAVVRADGMVLSSVVASQDEFHAHFGGVVPEIASRRHAELITAVVAEALSAAEVEPADLSLIAVVNGPGLIGSLVVGVAAAKAYSVAWSLPIVAVNHVEAHVTAAWLFRSPEERRCPTYPAVALVVSGGHTDLVLLRSDEDAQVLGSTRDDAAGEALDKAARLLGLGYPGGPALERAGKEGQPTAFSLPAPHVPGYDFSFAGLKSALARLVEEMGEVSHSRIADLAASFQEAIVRVLWEKARAAALETCARQLILAGGVAANTRLRQVFCQIEADGIEFVAPAREFCTDNAAMVALCGATLYRRRGADDLTFDVFSALPWPGAKASTR